MKIELDMYQTLALAVLVLMLGKFLRERVRLLDKFCIPAPVIGGVLFAIFTCICYVTGVAEFAFDDTLKEVCMVMFFTSVGFQANLKVLKSGGKAMIVFLGVVIVLIVSQNFLAVGLANLLDVDPLVRPLHRLHPHGGRPRHRRCLWPGAGGLWHQGCHHPVHRRRHLRPDRRQHDGRPARQDAH